MGHGGTCPYHARREVRGAPVCHLGSRSHFHNGLMGKLNVRVMADRRRSSRRFYKDSFIRMSQGARVGGFIRQRVTNGSRSCQIVRASCPAATVVLPGLTHIESNGVGWGVFPLSSPVGGEGRGEEAQNVSSSNPLTPALSPLGRGRGSPSSPFAHPSVCVSPWAFGSNPFLTTPDTSAPALPF